MTKLELLKKYKSETLVALPSDIVGEILKNEYTSVDALPKEDAEILFDMPIAKSIFRYEAELDKNYRQVVAYILLYDEFEDKYFVTYRLGGDERLQNQYSIAVGGHMDGENDATIDDTISRELHEELRFHGKQHYDAALKGFICSSSCPVDCVHVGFVYVATINTKQTLVSVRETNKLSGKWITRDELATLCATGQLESWSTICYNNIIALEGNVHG